MFVRAYHINIPGGDSISKSKIKCEVVSLPVLDGEYYITFSNILISAIKKLVIKDVIDYADKKINKTKEIVEHI